MGRFRRLYFKPFKPLEGNVIRIRIHLDEWRSQKIYVVIPPEAVNDYVSDALHRRPKHYAVLREHCKALIPKMSWGMYVPIRMNGKFPPECDLRWINWKKLKKNGGPFFNKQETVRG